MQLLAERLYEFGENDGLGWISGSVVSLREIDGVCGRVPHTGWNRVEPCGEHAALIGHGGKSCDYYFSHTYTLLTKEESAVAARSEYGASLVAALSFDTVLATQFHPEKSQLSGQRFLERFLEWAP